MSSGELGAVWKPPIDNSIKNGLTINPKLTRMPFNHPMGELKKIIQTTKYSFTPPDWPAWDKQEASSQTISDYISLSELLLLMKSKAPNLSWLDKQKLDLLSKNTKELRSKISIYGKIFKPLRTIFILSVIASMSAITLHHLGDNFLAEKIALGGVAIFFATGIPASFLSIKLNSMHQKNFQVPISELVLPEFINDASKAQKALQQIREFSPTPYVCEADTKIRSFTKSYWKADCWEVGLFLDMDRRFSVSLIGTPPSSEFIFLKSEIEALIEASNPTPNIYESYGLPRKTRWCPHIRIVQSRMGIIRSLIQKGDELIKSNLLDEGFIRQIEAYRVIKENGQNWKSLRKGTLDEDLKLKLEKKLREALFPKNSGAAQAQKLLEKLLKPDNRPFDEHISTWDIFPKKDLQKQINLYHQTKKK